MVLFRRCEGGNCEGRGCEGERCNEDVRLGIPSVTHLSACP